LSDGQKFVGSAGYVKLTDEQLKESLAKSEMKLFQNFSSPPTSEQEDRFVQPSLPDRRSTEKELGGYFLSSHLYRHFAQSQLL